MTTLRPLLAYVPWQARDALGRAVVPIVVFAALAGLPIWAFARQTGRTDFMVDGPARDTVLMMYAQTLPLAITLGALLLMSQSSALDRERQYFRFVFAHQVPPWAYYLQRYTVALAIFVACCTVIPIAFTQVVTPVPVLAVVRSAALSGFLIGSLAMLCGVLVQRDGLLLIAIYLGATLLQQLERLDRLPGWLATVAVALPPVHAHGELREAWLTGRAASPGNLTLVLVYSSGLLLLSLLLLRRLALAR